MATNSRDSVLDVQSDFELSDEEFDDDLEALYDSDESDIDVAVLESSRAPKTKEMMRRPRGLKIFEASCSEGWVFLQLIIWRPNCGSYCLQNQPIHLAEDDEQTSTARQVARCHKLCIIIG